MLLWKSKYSNGKSLAISYKRNLAHFELIVRVLKSSAIMRNILEVQNTNIKKKSIHNLFLQQFCMQYAKSHEFEWEWP